MVTCFGIKLGRKSKNPSTGNAVPARKTTAIPNAGVSTARADGLVAPLTSRLAASAKSMAGRKPAPTVGDRTTTASSSTPSVVEPQAASRRKSVSRANSDTASVKSMDTVDSVFEGARVSKAAVPSTEKMTVLEAVHKDGEKWLDDHKLHRGRDLPGSHAHFEAFSHLNMPEINAAFGLRFDGPAMRMRLAEWLMDEAELCNDGSGPGTAAPESLMRRLDTAIPDADPDAGQASPEEVASAAFKHQPELAEKFSKLRPAQQQHVAAVLDHSNRPGDQTIELVAISIASMAGIGVKLLVFDEESGMKRTVFGDHSSKFATIALTPHTQACQPVLGRDRKREAETVDEAPGRVLHVGRRLQDVLGAERETSWVKPDANNFFEALKTLPQVQDLLSSTVGAKPSVQDIRWHLADKAVKYLADFNAVKDPEERNRMMEADPLLAKLNGLPPGIAPANLNQVQYFRPLSVLMSRGGGFLSLNPIQKTHVINIARDQGAGQGTEALFPEVAAKLLGLRFRMLTEVNVHDGEVVSAVAEEQVGAVKGPDGKAAVEAVLVRRPDPSFVDPVVPKEPIRSRDPSLAGSAVNG
jgi:hypothetical protein